MEAFKLEEITEQVIPRNLKIGERIPAVYRTIPVTKREQQLEDIINELIGELAEIKDLLAL